MRLTVGILTISDRAHQGIYKDLAGPTLASEARKQSWEVLVQKVVPDEKYDITTTLLEWCDTKGISLIVTTGGTGIGPRDVTVEATEAILEKELPGIAEWMRLEGLKQTPFALLSRAMAGIRKKSLIVNLPGSPQGALKAFQAISPVVEHALLMLEGANHSHPALNTKKHD